MCAPDQVKVTDRPLWLVWLFAECALTSLPSVELYVSTVARPAASVIRLSFPSPANWNVLPALSASRHHVPSNVRRATRPDGAA